MYRYTNFFIVNLKFLFNIIYYMILIYDYNKLVFYVVMFIIMIGILAFLLTFVFSPHSSSLIKNSLDLQMIENFNFL